MSEISDDLYQRLHGFKAVQRISSDSDKSNWYYIDPRYEEGNPHREIDVNNENEVNPLLREVLAYDVWKNPSEYYIWQTVGDERVRPEHEEHDGYAFNWHIPSENGYPGSEYNCRCSAISYSPKKHKVITVDLRGLNIGDDEDDLIITINNAFINQVLSETLYKDDEVDYSLYGEGFTKEFIDQMLNDDEFQRILNEYIIPNEGGFSDRINDRGGKTKYGISYRTYPDEDINNLTRERANAIIYRDFYKWNGMDKLPYCIKGFVVDYGMTTSPLNAIRTVHKILNLPPNGTIIGFSTINKLSKFSEADYENFLNQYKVEMNNYYNSIVKKDPSQRSNIKGWINRANRAHLAK